MPLYKKRDSFLKCSANLATRDTYMTSIIIMIPSWWRAWFLFNQTDWHDWGHYLTYVRRSKCPAPAASQNGDMPVFKPNFKTSSKSLRWTAFQILLILDPIFLLLISIISYSRLNTLHIFTHGSWTFPEDHTPLCFITRPSFWTDFVILRQNCSELRLGLALW